MLNKKNITLLRQEIDIIDNKIVKLLDNRLKISLSIAKEKQKSNTNIYDKNRENYIINRLKKINKIYLSDIAIEKIYKEILNNSVNEMKKSNVSN